MSFIDAAQIDKNTQVLTGLEGNWGLPPLPDQTKLDLASMDGVDHHALGQFATGLASDVKQATTPAPTPTVIPPTQQDTTPNYSITEQFQRTWAGLNDKPAPDTLDDNGVVAFKQRAKRLGLLDPSTPEDSTWNPALNQARWQVMQHDSNAVFSGNHPGAISTNGLSKFVGDWLSPSGLLKAAVKLNFLPDFGKTANDSKGFLHTLSDVVSHPGLESFKNLFTKNPLLDLGIPVLNDALLLSGVGEVWGMARAATLPLEGAELAGAADSLLGSSKLASAAGFIRSSNYAQDLQRFQEASKLSEYVAKAGPVGAAVADKMQAWRELESVAVAKKGMQAGMRLGLAQKVEDKLGISGGNGTSLSSIPGVKAYTDKVVTNPLVSTIGEALFTPPNLLEPGTYLNAAKAVNPLRFLRVPQDQQLSVAFLNGVRDHLASTDPEALGQLNDSVGKLGPAKGLAQHLLGGTTDQHLDDLGKAMTYTSIAAAMDSMAAAKADLVADRVANPERWQQVWQTYRNKYIAQVRLWDGMNTDQLLAHKAAMLAAEDDAPVLKASKVYKGLVSQASSDPEFVPKLHAEVAHHDSLAQGFQAELLNEAARPEVIGKYLPQVMDTFGDWSQFANAQSNVFDAVQNGVLDEARYLQPYSERGARLVSVPAEMADAKAALPAIPYHQQLFDSQGYIPWMSSRMYSPLARAIDPSVGAYTVARQETPTKQEMLQFLQSVRGRQKLLKDVGQVERSTSDSQVFEALSQAAQDNGLEGVHQLDNQTANDIITNMRSARYGAMVGPQQDQLPGLSLAAEGQGAGSHSDPLTRVLSWMRHAGYGDLSTMRQGLEGDLRSLDASPLWADRYGIPHFSQTDDGLTPATLESKAKALFSKTKFTAAEVDAPDGMELPAGYKLVHGVQYLLPSDLLYTSPIKDLTESQVRRATLGAWFTHQDNNAFGSMLGKTQRLNLSQRLSALSPEDLQGISPNLDSADLDTVLGTMHGIINKEQDRVAEVLQSHGIGRVKKALLTGSVPQSVDDLGNAYNRNLVMKSMQDIGYTQPFAAASWQALKDSQQGSFKRYGLATMEKTLKQQTPLLRGLDLLSGTNAGDSLLGKTAARLAPTALGAAAGYTAGNQVDGQQGGLIGALAGGAAGAAGTPAIQKTAGALATKFHNDWLQYAYIGDQYEHLRDTARFTLNPFFDVRRFVKSVALAHTAELPADISLPPIPGKASFVKQFGEDAFNGYANEMRQVSRGTFDPNAIEDTHQYFTQMGLLGYNPTDWMTHMYGRLRMADVAPADALDTVKKVYAYGTQGRSAAEQSLNYVLFPFSFEKKVATALGKYLSKDLSRTVMIHDAIKTYSVLDDNFDLHDKLREYVPLASEMEKLNPLDHGLSLGEVGGINAPLLRLFLPQVFPVSGSKDQNALAEYGRRLLPFWGEVSHLKDSLAEQGHVLFSPNHMTTQSETDAGFAATRALRDQWDQALQGKHVSWQEMQRDPSLAPLKSAYDEQAAEILAKYPSYASEREKLPEQNTKLQDEMSVRLNDPTYSNRPENVALGEFKVLNDRLDEALRQQGYSWTDAPDLIPPAAFDAVHQDAVALARQSPKFADLYKRFYANKYGPITREMT